MINYESSRDMAVVKVDNEYYTVLYRSTGSAGIRGAWFPCAGVIGKGQLAKWEDFYENDEGWIVKNVLLSYVVENKKSVILSNYQGKNHRTFDDRFKFTGIPSSLQDVAVKLTEMFSGKLYLTSVNAEGINTWIRDAIITDKNK